MWPFRKKQPEPPRWYVEYRSGSLRAFVGQTIDSDQEAKEMIVRFQFREKWEWLDIAVFRYLDWPNVQRLVSDVDKYVRTLIAQD